MLKAAQVATSERSGGQTPSTVRWRILSSLCALSFVSYLLRGNLSIAAPNMMADLHLSEIQWGWVMAAFPLGYALFQLPGGVLGQRVGPRRAMAGIAIAWGLLVVLTAAVPTLAMAPTTAVLIALIAIQFLVGVVHAPVFPVLAVAVERWFPKGSLGLPYGLSSTALTVGLALTASLLPWLIASAGWRTAFVFMAPSAFVIAMWWWWIARDFPEQHNGVNSAELALIGKRAAVAARSGSSWLQVLKNRDVLLVTLSYSSLNFVYYIIFSWGYYYLVKVRGFAEQEAGFLTAAQWVGAGLGAALGGWICDLACRRIGLRWGCRWPILIGTVGCALLLLGVAWSPNAYLAALLLGLCFFCHQISEGPYWACVTAIGGRDSGVASGLMNTGGNAMGFVNAILLSVLANAVGWAIALSIGAIFAVLAAALILLVRADLPMHPVEING